MRIQTFFLTLLYVLVSSFCFAQAELNVDYRTNGNIYIDESISEIEKFIEESQLEDGVFHLFAHGRPGELFIENQWLGKEEVEAFLKPLVLDLAGSSKFSHLNIYACDFAKGEKGLSAMHYLNTMFQGGVAASNNKVGDSKQGGDWEMEVVLGKNKNILELIEWQGLLQITFSYVNNYTNVTTLANYNCAGFTTMDATAISNGSPLTITFSCPVTSVSIPIISLGDSNVEVYSFDAVGSPETISTTCPEIDIVGNTAANNTGGSSISGVEAYIAVNSTVPFTQVIVSFVSGSFVAGVMNVGTGYWSDPCTAVQPCTTPSPCTVSGPATITTGGSGTYSTAAPSPTGTTSSWEISPTTGVSNSSGTGINTGGVTFANPGTYTLTFTHTNSSNPSGCSPSDSITCSFTINVNNSCTTITDTSTIVSCDSAQINNTWYYSTQTVNDTFIGGAANGCDSVHVSNLSINNSTFFTDIQIHCDSFTWIDGNTYLANNNSATFTSTNSQGCDSIVSLDLSINATIATTDLVVACDSFTWIDGNTYITSNNSATHTIASPGACDTTVTLNLTINNSNSSTDVISACNSYTWIDGNTYSANNNTATFTLTNSNNCDSIVSLDLTIDSNIMQNDVVVACDSFTWIDGNTYITSNNSATHTIVSPGACDTTVTLNLTINNSNSSTDVISACSSYTWIDGNTYSANNNTATFTLTNSNNCDSIVSLNLTIDTSVLQTDIISACDSFTWIDGNTYTANNSSAAHTLAGNGSCDTIVTLNLTINNSSLFTDIISACNSYTWLDGITYTSNNNTATQNYVSSAGCDSVVTLDLTIGTPDTTADFRFACDTFTWIDGITYTTSNNTAHFTIVGGSSDGCDSIVALNLGILPYRFGFDTIRACDSVEINNNMYFSSQTVVDTFLANASCDSFATTVVIIETSSISQEVGIDTTLCFGDTLGLDARDLYGNNYTYQWQNNAMGPLFETTQSGSFRLTAIDNNLCAFEQQALVNFEDCSENCIVLAPSGFTPNQDGQNDLFNIFRVCESPFSNWDVKIYNRWGELIFKSTDFNDQWDGNYKGKLCPIGVYSYIVEYSIAGSSEKQLVKGTVTLIR